MGGGGRDQELQLLVFPAVFHQALPCKGSFYMLKRLGLGSAWFWASPEVKAWSFRIPSPGLPERQAQCLNLEAGKAAIFIVQLQQLQAP